MSSIAKHRFALRDGLTLNRVAGGVFGLAVIVFAAASIISSMPAAHAEDLDVNVLDAVDDYISLQIIDSANCPNSTDLTLNIEPNSLLNGTITSDCATVKVDTSNVYGYAMTISGSPDGKLTRTAGDSYYLDPVASATAAAPKVLSTDTWGWALGGFSGFNSTYTKENSNNLSISTSKWAAIPTGTSQIIHQPNAGGTWTNSDVYDLFFAAAADKSTPQGQYTGTVTFTVSSEGMQLLDDGIVVDRDSAMIPVAYVGSTSGPVWVKADETNSQLPNTVNSNGGTYDWYDYNKKTWANSVTVKAAGTQTRAYYQSAPAGTIINAADVVGYWVYIPRYRYQTWTYTWNATNYPKSIKVEIEDCHSNGTACTTAGYDKASVDELSTTTPGGWLTHPAFTFNGHELNGFWVGKYEMTGTTAAPTVLPDSAPSSNQTLGAVFTASKAISGTDGVTLAGNHGMSSLQSNTRLPNNNNWGAVAYLSQSLFGVCTNVACTESGVAATSMSPANPQKVWNNGTGQCINGGVAGRTGYGNGGKSDTCSTNIGVNDANTASTYTTDNAYYSTNGKLASTTNDITGVYDMAGGQWEYTLGVYNNTLATASSGISTFDAKYMQNYPNPPLTNSPDDIWNGKYNFTASFKIALGQAIFETGGGSSSSSSWYADASNSIEATAPWSIKGGHSGGNNNGTYSGVFANARTLIPRVDFGARPIQSAP